MTSATHTRNTHQTKIKQMPSDNEGRSKQESAIIYKAWRTAFRNFLAQVLTNKELSADEMVVAIADAISVNAATGDSFVCPLTLAKQLGIRLDCVNRARSGLSRKGQIKITPRAGKTDLVRPVVKHDARDPRIMRRGSTEFLKARSDLIKRIIFDTRLTAAQRIVAVVIVATADEKWLSDTSNSAVASITGLSRSTVVPAMRKLIDVVRYFDPVPAPGSLLLVNPDAGNGDSGLYQDDINPMSCRAHAEPETVHSGVQRGVQSGVQEGVQRGVQSESGKTNKDGHSSRYPYYPNDLHDPNDPNDHIRESLRDSRRATGGAPGRAAPLFSFEEGERFEALVAFIDSHGKSLKMCEIIAFSNPDRYKLCPDYEAHLFEAREVQKFVKAGLLTRNGEQVSVSDFGRQSLKAFEAMKAKAAQQRKAA